MKESGGFTVTPPRSEILRYLGGRRGMQGSDRVEAMVDRALEESGALIRTAAVYAILGQESPFPQPRFLRAEMVGVGICTIGPGLEERVRELFSTGDSPLAVTLDAVGSAAAEEAAEHVDALICIEAQESGLSAGRRMSPGYGRFTLEEQLTMFRVLDAAPIGVQLTETLMMVPRKSVSFAVPLLREASRRSTSRCACCEMVDCRFRKEG